MKKSIIISMALALAACGGPSAQQKKACEMFADIAGPGWRTDISDMETNVQAAKIVAARGITLPAPDVEAMKQEVMRIYAERYAATSKRVAETHAEATRAAEKFYNAVHEAYQKERDVQGPAHVAADVLSKARYDAQDAEARETTVANGEFRQASAIRDEGLKAAEAAKTAFLEAREQEAHAVEYTMKRASELREKHNTAHGLVEFRLTMTKREVDEALVLCTKKETK